MYASNLFRTVAPVLRRTTANPQAANIKQRTGPNMGAIAIALVGVAGAYWIFGTKKAQDAKEHVKKNEESPATRTTTP